MNTPLANSKVPRLFEGDDHTALMTQLKEDAQRQGIKIDINEKQLHITVGLNKNTKTATKIKKMQKSPSVKSAELKIKNQRSLWLRRPNPKPPTNTSTKLTARMTLRTPRTSAPGPSTPPARFPPQPVQRPLCQDTAKAASPSTSPTSLAT